MKFDNKMLKPVICMANMNKNYLTSSFGPRCDVIKNVMFINQEFNEFNKFNKFISQRRNVPGTLLYFYFDQQ